MNRLIRFLPVFNWLLFLLAGPFFLFPSPSRIGFLLMLPLFFAVNIIFLRRPLPLTPLNPSLLLLALMVLVSLWATTDLAASLPKIVGLLYGIWGFFLVADLTRRPRGFSLGLILVAAVGAGITLLALPGTNWDSKLFLVDWLTARLPPAFVSLPGARDGFHPAEVAGALLWVLPLTLAASWAALRRSFPFQSLRLHLFWFEILSLAGLIESAVLILAQSRGAYLSLILTIFLFILAALQSRLGGRNFFCAAGAFLSLTLVASVIFWQKLTAFVASLPTLISQNVLSLETLRLREIIWSRAAEALRDFALTGMGLNRFREVLFLLYPTFGLKYGEEIGHAHNELLQAGLDLGLPGLVAFIAIYLVAFAMLYQIYRRAVRPGAQWVVLGLAASLLAHFLFGLVDAVSLGAKPGLLFWLLLGLTAGLYQQVFAPVPEAGE